MKMLGLIYKYYFSTCKSVSIKLISSLCLHTSNKMHDKARLIQIVWHMNIYFISSNFIQTVFQHYILMCSILYIWLLTQRVISPTFMIHIQGHTSDIIVISRNYDNDADLIWPGPVDTCHNHTGPDHGLGSAFIQTDNYLPLWCFVSTKLCAHYLTWDCINQLHN